MNIFNTKKSYAENKISKTEYIAKMFKSHKMLYNYADFVAGTEIKSIYISEGSVIIEDRHKVKLLCSNSDRRLAPIEILNFGHYEKDEMKMSISLIEDGFTIFDIGANYGWYSLHFSKKFKKAKIFAFEPIKKTFSFLEKNIRLNRSLNIKALNFGFSDKKEQRILYFRPFESGSASFADLLQDNKAKKMICKMIPIDDFIKSEKTKIDFIKCDVEGAELFVFKGGMKSIKKYKPIIFSEMLRKWSAKLNYHPNKIIRMFEKEGYACYFIEEGKLKRLETMTDDTIQTNFFFLHQIKHKSKINRFS